MFWGSRDVVLESRYFFNIVPPSVWFNTYLAGAILSRSVDISTILSRYVDISKK